MVSALPHYRDQVVYRQQKAHDDHGKHDADKADNHRFYYFAKFV